MKRINLETTEGQPHSDRPWVFFMVDCFFLITQFFVLTFKFKTDESILPQHMPPGSHIPKPGPVVQSLRVHVHSDGGPASYEILGEQFSLDDLTGKLNLWNQSGQHAVRVSYDSTAPWSAVFAVFNSCKKASITDCGLISSHGTNVSGGGFPPPR